MDKLNSKEARHLFTLPALQDIQTNWTYRWDRCEGELDGSVYVVNYYRDGILARTIKFTLATYLAEIKRGRNDWINNKILNRSELAGRIWQEDISQNRLRRRLENKAYWNTFTEGEKRKILEELENLLLEVKKSFLAQAEID
jgi:hypothetical protein